MLGSDYGAYLALSLRITILCVLSHKIFYRKNRNVWN